MTLFFLYRARYHRANRLQRLRWQLGAVLPEDVKELLHPSEKEFVKSYSEALSSYMTKLDIDLAVVSSRICSFSFCSFRVNIFRSHLNDFAMITSV